MNNRAHDHQAFDVIHNEHRELLGVFAKLMEAVVRDGHDKAEVENLTGELVERFDSHFRHDLNGGQLEEVTKRIPALSARAADLLDQQALLLEQVETLRILVHSGVESPAWWKRVRLDVEKLHSDLSLHDTAVEQLVREAFGDDHSPGQ